MKAMDVMVRDVVTVSPDDNIADAIKLLIEHDISALPVVDEDDHVIGVISEADLIRRDEIGTDKHRPWWLEALTPASTLANEFAKSHGRRVRELMSSVIISASEDTPLEQIATLLEKHRIKRIPVLRDGKLVGIVSRSNLIQALASSLPHAAATGDSDRQIRLELLDRLHEQTWTDFGSRNIIVSGGVVHLWGLVGSPEERKALIALAEGVPGVKRVSDEMILGMAPFTTRSQPSSSCIRARRTFFFEISQQSGDG
jgi:CBS domain-containing protein